MSLETETTSWKLADRCACPKCGKVVQAYVQNATVHICIHSPLDSKRWTRCPGSKRVIGMLVGAKNTA